MTWATVTIGDSCDVIAGGTPKRSEPRYWDGDIPWVKISDMLQGRIAQTDESITQAGLDGSAAKLLPPGTLLVSIFATIGRTAVLHCEAATNQAIVGVIPKQPDQFDARFLEYSLQEKTAELERKARGVAQVNINGAMLKATEIPLPPLAEQKRIAGILDAADALRAKRRESLAQLDTLLQSTFLEMFGDPVTNPMGWDCTTVGQALEAGLLVEVKDGNHGEQHPKVADFSSEGVPFIMSNCMCDGGLDLSKAYKLSEEWLGRLRPGFSHGGDVLLSHKGTIGEVAIVPVEVELVILSPQVTYYRTSESLHARYLAGMFAAEGFQRLLEKDAKQSTRA